MSTLNLHCKAYYCVGMYLIWLTLEDAHAERTSATLDILWLSCLEHGPPTRGFSKTDMSFDMGIRTGVRRAAEIC